MSTFTVTLKERGQDSPEMFPPCCGLEPYVYVWPKGGHIAVMCSREECENHQGVLAGRSDIDAKWERFRVKAV